MRQINIQIRLVIKAIRLKLSETGLRHGRLSLGKDKFIDQNF